MNNLELDLTWEKAVPAFNCIGLQIPGGTEVTSLSLRRKLRGRKKAQDNIFEAIRSFADVNISKEFVPRGPSQRSPRSLCTIFVQLIAAEDLQCCGVRHGGSGGLEQFSSTDDEQTDDEDAIGAVRLVQPLQVLTQSLLLRRR